MASHFINLTLLPDSAQRLSNLCGRLNEHIQQIAMVGGVESVLITGISKKDPGALQGRTENNRVVNFRCDDHSLIGQFVRIEITDALPNSLLGNTV